MSAITSAQSVTNCNALKMLTAEPVTDCHGLDFTPDSRDLLLGDKLSPSRSKQLPKS